MKREIERIVEEQRRFFSSGRTKEYGFRRRALRSLFEALKEQEGELEQALKKDLNKSVSESCFSEIGLTLSELGYARRHLKEWMRPERAAASLSQLPAECFIVPEPYGVALIMAPWNYPVLLCLEPLIAAIAAGNCAVLKPSAYAPAVSAALKKMLKSIYPEKYVAVVEGGREENRGLLEQRFDCIFFTGGVSVGRLVLEKAAANLTPVTLELGGKSPCIVDETADLKLAARRIAFGKLLNAGQTCVAPDYLAVQESVREELCFYLQKELERMLGEALANPDYPAMINRKHFDRVASLIKSSVTAGASIRFGGGAKESSLQIEPTVLTDVTPDMPVMGEEIFGPVLPAVTWRTKKELKRLVGSFDKPLALYLFSRSKKMQAWTMKTFSFGGGCVNDTVLHLASPRMPFGGVGKSGMGAYHGKTGFETFSHKKSVVRKISHPDNPLRYHPYTRQKEKLLRLALR